MCLIGRVNDHKREFFSRISQIKAKNGSPVKAEIYFATHWHIPTYYLDENPNIREQNWLNEVVKLQNTPENIKKIARSILIEIEPKGLDSFKDYKYLPKIRNDFNRIPKKELIQVREEIGKVIGYRFYKESFGYFNNLIRKYEGISKDNRNKEMELLCSTFLFEPYLFQKIKQVLPDINDKIEEFIDALIFGNPKKQNRRINIETELTYEWDKKDILHLFFIVYNGVELSAKLSDIEALKKLMQFIEDVDYAINYFLYKILAYFPIKKEEIQVKKNTGLFLHLFDIILQENLVPNKFIKEIKIFRSFISTLPTDTDYYSGLARINENYRKLTDAILHKQSVLVECDYMLVDLEAMNNEYNEAAKAKFIASWVKVGNFIEDILSFSGTFPTFFLDKLTSIEGSGEYSLRVLHGKLNDLVNNLNLNSEFELIKLLLTKFIFKFLHSDSDLFKIFSKISTKDPIEKITRIVDQREDIKSGLNITNNITEEITLDLPLHFFNEIILSEIITNFRHREPGSEIKLSFSIEQEYLVIQIENVISSNPTHGGGSGLNILQGVNKFPKEIVKYKQIPSLNSSSKIFRQELRIKKA